MTDPLAGVRLRLDRADQRLALLDRQRTILLKRKRNRVIGKFDMQSGDYVLRVPGRLPPLGLGLTVGEFAYFLRSALDNLLWRLVEAHGNTPTRQTQFPIYEDKTKSLVKTKGGVPKIEAETAGISGPNVTFIEGLQPYHAGRNLERWHPLAMLGYLNDVDKHRYVHPTFAAASVAPVGGPHDGRTFFQSAAADHLTRLGIIPSDLTKGFDLDPAMWEETGPQSHRLRFGLVGLVVPVQLKSLPGYLVGLSVEGRDDDPAEVARVFGLRTVHPKSKVEMEPRLLLEVAFSERGRPLNIFDLHEIRATVQKVFDTLAPDIV